VLQPAENNNEEEQEAVNQPHESARLAYARARKEVEQFKRECTPEQRTRAEQKLEDNPADLILLVL